MRTSFAAFAAVVGMIVGTGSVIAHHSFAAEFDANKALTLKGVVTKIEWQNPHTYFYLDVTMPDSKVVNWGMEMGSQRVDASGLDPQHAQGRRRRHR